MRQANHFATRLIGEAGDDVDKQIDLAWRLALTRPPTKNEMAATQKFLADQRAELSAENKGTQIASNILHKKALAQLCRVIFNLNEFVYVD